MDMRTHFRTLSGSEYIIDNKALTWKRLSHASESNRLRTEEGMLSQIPTIKIHEVVFIIGPALKQSDEIAFRMIETTEVTEIWIEQ